MVASVEKSEEEENEMITYLTLGDEANIKDDWRRLLAEKESIGYWNEFLASTNRSKHNIVHDSIDTFSNHNQLFKKVPSR